MGGSMPCAATRCGALLAMQLGWCQECAPLRHITLHSEPCTKPHHGAVREPDLNPRPSLDPSD